MNKYVLPIIVAVSFSSGWIVRSYIADADIAEIKLKHERIAKSMSDAALKQQRELQEKSAEIETKHYQEMRNAQIEIDSLRADVVNGNKRLYINATCPELPKTSSMDNGKPAELNRDARQDYFSLRSGIERVTKQLIACQDLLR